MRPTPAPSQALRNSRLATLPDTQLHTEQVVQILSLGLPADEQARRIARLDRWTKYVRRGAA